MSCLCFSYCLVQQISWFQATVKHLRKLKLQSHFWLKPSLRYSYQLHCPEETLRNGMRCPSFLYWALWLVSSVLEAEEKNRETSILWQPCTHLEEVCEFLGNARWPLSDACHVENVQWPDDFANYKFKLFRGLWRESPCCTVSVRHICLESMYFCAFFPLLSPVAEVHPAGLLGKSFCLYFWVEKV